MASLVTVSLSQMRRQLQTARVHTAHLNLSKVSHGALGGCAAQLTVCQICWSNDLCLNFAHFSESLARGNTNDTNRLHTKICGLQLQQLKNNQLSTILLTVLVVFQAKCHICCLQLKIKSRFAFFFFFYLWQLMKCLQVFNCWLDKTRNLMKWLWALENCYDKF